VLAKLLFVAAIAVTVLSKGWGAGLLLAVIALTGMAAGALMAGVRARNGGDGFWEGFTGFIREEWAVSAAITGTLVLATAGIGLAAKGGVALAGAKATVPNAVKLAAKFTHNKKSSVVVIGKTDGGASTGYVAVAKKSKATYFRMSDTKWVKLRAEYGPEFMWDMNKAFLEQQMAMGKTFKASHAIDTATFSFREEILFLQDNGIIIIQL